LIPCLEEETVMFPKLLFAALGAAAAIGASSTATHAEPVSDMSSSKLVITPAVLHQASDESGTPVAQVQYRRGYRSYYQPYYRGRYAYSYPSRSYYYPRYSYGYYPYSYRYPSYGYYSYSRPYYGGYRGYYPRYYSGYRGGFSYYGPRFYGSYFW
jgi:hypothetical protein